MKAIRTTSRLGIDQRRLQVVFAEKPVECAHCSDRPLLAVIRAPRGKARGNRRRSPRPAAGRTLRALRRILPKLFEPTGLKHPDGAVCIDMSQRSDSKTGLDVATAYGSPGPFQSRPAKDAHCRKRERLRTRANPCVGLQETEPSTCRPIACACRWRKGLRPPACNRRPNPEARRPRRAATRTSRQPEARS